jgi:hypothetical protein
MQILVKSCPFMSIHAIMAFAIELFRKFSKVDGRGVREVLNLSFQAFGDTFASLSGQRQKQKKLCLLCGIEFPVFPA